MDREREPIGDYGYDLAHEEVDQGKRPDDRTAPEHSRPAPSRPAESGGDYGYDEAHGF